LKDFDEGTKGMKADFGEDDNLLATAMNTSHSIITQVKGKGDVSE
jgi:hypothetical protein